MIERTLTIVVRDAARKKIASKLCLGFLEGSST
jgi:hypothetical protein